jgi:hypothetical protein
MFREGSARDSRGEYSGEGAIPSVQQSGPIQRHKSVIYQTLISRGAIENAKSRLTICWRIIRIPINKRERTPYYLLTTMDCPHLLVRTRHSGLKVEFLRALATDLTGIGAKVYIRKSRSRLSFSADLSRVSARAAQERFLARARENRREQTEFIGQTYEYARTRFADAQLLIPSRIQPKLVPCSSLDQLRLFKFCQLVFSAIPNVLLYRRLQFLVVDEGHLNQPVMGIIALTSPSFTLGCRDKLLHWTGSVGTRRRCVGLRRILHLSTCIAVPPYNLLFAGKLLAALATSREVQEELTRRYGSDEVLAVTTTVASGIHGPIFNRIMLKPGGLYKRIGETKGYSSCIFSRRTLNLARELVRHHDGPVKNVTDRSIRTLKRALNLVGIPRERVVRLGVRKGVYIAFTADDALERLRGCVPRARRNHCGPLEAADIINVWRCKHLVKACSAPERLARLRTAALPAWR